MLATVLATIAGGVLFPFWIYPRYLPPGVYPRIVLAIPIVLCGVAVAALGTWMLKLLGIPTSVPLDDEPGAR